MEIRNLKVGDHFVKWDGKLCRLDVLNDCRAQIFVRDEMRRVNVSPMTEIQRVLEKDETEKELAKVTASDRADTNAVKEDRVMKVKKDKVAKNNGAELPDIFVRKYQGTVHTMERKGEGWLLDGSKDAVTLRDAMTTIAKGLADTKRMDAWSPPQFFRAKSIQVVKDFSEIEKPKVEKRKIPVRAVEPPPARPIKSKKVAKKAKAKNGKKELKFSKKAQTASKPKKSLSEMAKELSKTEAA